MLSTNLTTPVVFIIFNRPDTTKLVFEEIRKAQPQKLLVIADGPRIDHPEDIENCKKTRSLIKVDWDCELLTNYSDINLGCGIRPASGISWAFKQVEKAIILEDDCLPHSSFFQFCQELLEKYSDDERIMSISGDNFYFDYNQTEYSYSFSKYPQMWGWATWRRVWQKYDYDIHHWPDVLKMGLLDNMFSTKRHKLYWKKIFQQAYQDPQKTYWDYQFLFACWVQNGLNIIPSKNLISNIGFGPNATHTINPKDICSNLAFEAIPFPLKHPSFVIQNYKGDDYNQKTMFSPTLVTRIRNKIKRILKSTN